MRLPASTGFPYEATLNDAGLRASSRSEIYKSALFMASRPPPSCPDNRDLMLATAAEKPFDRPGWLFELKYDGFRVLAIHQGETRRVLSRRGNDLSGCFPEIVACLGALPELVLDGELVVLDERGKPQFERLRRRALLKKPTSIEQAARSEPAAIFAFDLLILGGRDMRKLPLLKRKEALQKTLSESKRIRSVQHVGEMGKRLYDAACGLSLEGIVAKRADAPYSAGRSRDWIKIRTPQGRQLQDERSEQWGG